ncbi:MAG: hypothetical protein Greene07147_129 [Parcubacteria group bacterium Greene0714_7]|nr:MAG: hypothetical protein Greene07147_129 [Parcubacteria group bacterium Greene0714_7]
MVNEYLARMKLSPTLIVAFGALLLIIGLSILYFFSFGSNATETATTNEDFFSATFPFFGTKDDRSPVSTTSQGVPVQSSKTLEVRTVTGDILFVEDFTKDPDVIAEPDNRVFYVLYPNATSTNPSEFDYEINYFPSDHSFSLVLAGEPLAEVRRKAADDLAKRVGLSQKELCSIVATVQTPRWVNQYYADKNLGLPGCPGSVKFQGD